MQCKLSILKKDCQMWSECSTMSLGTTLKGPKEQFLSIKNKPLFEGTYFKTTTASFSTFPVMLVYIIHWHLSPKPQLISWKHHRHFELHKLINWASNNKGADQTAQMRRLVCACVVRKPPKTGFLETRPN